jgi:hypothetical protein
MTMHVCNATFKLELDQYPYGLYIARLTMAGLSVGEVKFSLVR